MDSWVDLLWNDKMGLIEVTAGITGIFLLRELRRYHIHKKNLEKIPYRIHVNGTRGKSSTTRLIAGALRTRRDLRVVAKTTGTQPYLIYPDGREELIFRPGRPNIIEQIDVVRKAKMADANVIVVECMAITPEYLVVFEDRLVQSNIGVITNVREDHLDTMGPTLKDVAYYLSLSLPRNGIAFTTEKRFFDVLAKTAKKRGTTLQYVDPERWVTEDDLKGFSYFEHPENVALALIVADHFGIRKEDALQGMYRATPDPGAMRVYNIPISGGHVFLYNALAANDPQSTEYILNRVKSKHPNSKIVCLMVIRPDRPQRTEAFAKVIGETLRGDEYIICGTPTTPLISKLLKKDISKEHVYNLEGATPEEIRDLCIKLLKPGDVIFAMGNIVGLGESIIATFMNLESET